MNPERRTKTTLRALRALKGYSAIKETDPQDRQIQTFAVTHPDGHTSIHRTVHGEARFHFWKKFPVLANPDVWEDVK